MNPTRTDPVSEISEEYAGIYLKILW